MFLLIVTVSKRINLGVLLKQQFNLPVGTSKVPIAYYFQKENKNLTLMVFIETLRSYSSVNIDPLQFLWTVFAELKRLNVGMHKIKLKWFGLQRQKVSYGFNH